MFRYLLYPFSVLYDLVTRLRNTLYDRGIKPSVSFEVPVISVGNLTVGGTGKTPMIEYLVRLLKTDHHVAILSRGYGRATKGFRKVGVEDSATTAGDEPFQYFKKFNEDVTIAVGEERAWAIPMILQENGDVDVILLDDAFQHRRVRPTFSVLLSEFNRPYYEDLVLPAGRLREARQGAERADVVIITKCPVETSQDVMRKMEEKIHLKSKKPVFFTTIQYGDPQPFSNTGSRLKRKVILVTGIANHRPLTDYVKENFELIDEVHFPDHYAYSLADLKKLAGKLSGSNDISFLTTEKDMVKIDVPGFASVLTSLPFFYIPITVRFLKKEADFNHMIREVVNEGSKNMA